MKYETHLRSAEQGMWGPIKGDPTPTHNTEIQVTPLPTQGGDGSKKS